MMSFICSRRNKNQPNDIYPKGTSHHTRLGKIRTYGAATTLGQGSYSYSALYSMVVDTTAL